MLSIVGTAQRDLSSCMATWVRSLEGTLLIKCCCLLYCLFCIWFKSCIWKLKCAVQKYPRSIFFNQGSVCGCQGFRRHGPKLPGTKFAFTVLCSCTNVSKVYYRKQNRHLGHCIGFHEQCKHLRMAPLQREGRKTLVKIVSQHTQSLFCYFIKFCQVSVISVCNPLLIYVKTSQLYTGM